MYQVGGVQSARVWFRKINIAPLFFSYLIIDILLTGIIFVQTSRVMVIAMLKKVLLKCIKRDFIVNIYQFECIEISFNSSQTLYKFSPEIVNCVNCVNLLIMFGICLELVNRKIDELYTERMIELNFAHLIFVKIFIVLVYLCYSSAYIGKKMKISYVRGD